MSKQQHIACPNCGTDIDVNDLLYHQLEEKARQKYQAQYATQTQELKLQKQQLDSEREILEQQVAEQVKNGLSKARQSLQKQIEEEQSVRVQAMEAELQRQTEKVIQLNAAQAEIEKLKREKQSLKTDIELSMQKQFSKQLDDESSKIKKQLESDAELKITEREQVIEQLRSKLQDAQRQAEQGSVQLQGEAQELVIEDWLRNEYPLDSIEEVKKGAQGADILQLINTRECGNCGSIYYESKRTKNYSPAWIEKFKADIQARGADIGVLITEAMPNDTEHLTQIDGVWVCSYREFKNLSKVLRQSLIRINQNLIVQENKGDKMGMLYDFLTGPEFRMQIEAIVEGFTQLKADLESEKRAMNSAWKKREKQIERVLLNTNSMYGSVKGIAGSAIQNVSMLEYDVESED